MVEKQLLDASFVKAKLVISAQVIHFSKCEISS
jgi:hypothetical protein